MEKTPFNRHSGCTQLNDNYTVFNHFVELPPLQKIVLKNILVIYCLLWSMVFASISNGDIPANSGIQNSCSSLTVLYLLTAVTWGKGTPIWGVVKKYFNSVLWLFCFFNFGFPNHMQVNKPLRAASTWNEQKWFLYRRLGTGPFRNSPREGTGCGREKRKKEEAAKHRNQRMLRPGAARERQPRTKRCFFLMRRQTGSQRFSRRRPGGQHVLCQTPFPWQHDCDWKNQRHRKGPWPGCQEDTCRAAYQVHLARAGRAQRSPPRSWRQGSGR